jgi:hypothetical protein
MPPQEDPNPAPQLNTPQPAPQPTPPVEPPIPPATPAPVQPTIAGDVTPPAPVVTSAPAPDQTDTNPQPAKKGFFAKLFHRG